MTKLTLPLKWHGGKRYLAEAIVQRMPRHLHYVEPFAGGLAVLLRRDPADPRLWLQPRGPRSGTSEVVGDVNGQLINFWKVLASPDLFAQFVRRAQVTPVSRQLWEEAGEYAPDSDPVGNAVAFFIRCRQSRSGMMKTFTPLTRNRTRRQMNALSSEWLGALEGLPDVHARLQTVVIEKRPAVDLIQAEDTPSTLFYCDPPYLDQTRTSPDVYEHEMTEADHRQLLATLLACKGKVILSGYPSDLYDSVLTRWARHVIPIVNHAAGGKTKRQMEEVLWMNYDPAQEAPLFLELQSEG